MNFKNNITSYLAILGVVGSVFGLNSLLTKSEVTVPVSNNDLDDSLSDKNVVCSNDADVFAQDELQVLASEYLKDETAECLFVGCGGVI